MADKNYAWVRRSLASIEPKADVKDLTNVDTEKKFNDVFPESPKPVIMKATPKETPVPEYKQPTPSPTPPERTTLNRPNRPTVGFTGNLGTNAVNMSALPTVTHIDTSNLDTDYEPTNTEEVDWTDPTDTSGELTDDDIEEFEIPDGYTETMTEVEVNEDNFVGSQLENLIPFNELEEMCKDD